MHKHKCPDCGLVWEHPNDGAPTKKVYDEAHLCPGCGTDQREKYYGLQPVIVANCTQYKPAKHEGFGRPPAIELLELLAGIIELEEILQHKGR